MTIGDRPAGATSERLDGRLHNADHKPNGNCGNKGFTLNCVAFNCKAFKQSSEYIAELMLECDVMCLSETWLRPGELSALNSWAKTHPKLCNADYNVLAKSAMEDNPGYCSGRPFGGVATIVKSHAHFSPSEI